MTTRTRTTKRMVAMVAVGLLAATGCGDDGDEASADTFCERFTTYEAERDAISERNAAAEGGLDVEELKAGYAEAQEGLDGLVASAPDEIADDVEVVVDAVREVDEQVAEAETVEDIASASEQLAGDDEVRAAGERVQEWVETGCTTGE